MRGLCGFCPEFYGFGLKRLDVKGVMLTRFCCVQVRVQVCVGYLHQSAVEERALRVHAPRLANNPVKEAILDLLFLLF